MSKLTEILKHYWGYDNFRPGQLDAIESLLSGRDTLVLYPTGGGKSLVYQVSGLLANEMTIVVSPLISLIVDQVRDLKNRGIKADYLDSQKDKSDVLRILENARLGHVKFLYVAPERFLSPTFLEKLKFLNVDLFAIDEAHCVSTWGHDFRPAYLSLKKIRDYKKDATICCLTATATPKVLADIQRVFNMESAGVFKKSFARENIAIQICKTQQKFIKLKEAIKRVDGSTIIYCRSRRNTEQLSHQLSQNGIKNRYYHAGVAYKERMKIQSEWMADNPKLIVATTAFGMGIDKPNVRLVCHVDIPNSLEDYYQEIGRAGRDGNRSEAFCFYSEQDLQFSNKKLTSSFPPKEELKYVLHSLYKYFDLAYGEGFEFSRFLDFGKWINKLKLDNSKVYSALNLLQRSGWVSIDQNYKQSSSLKVLVDRYLLDRVEHLDEYDDLLKHLLRHHEGLFYSYVRINIAQIAEALSKPQKTIHDMLTKLDKNQFVKYFPSKEGIRIQFLRPRPRPDQSVISIEYYESRKEFKEKQLQSVYSFLDLRKECRQGFLLDYFGEQEGTSCGVCDNCVKANTDSRPSKTELIERIEEESNLINLINAYPLQEQAAVKKLLQRLEERGDIKILADMTIVVS